MASRIQFLVAEVSEFANGNQHFKLEEERHRKKWPDFFGRSHKMSKHSITE